MGLYGFKVIVRDLQSTDYWVIVVGATRGRGAHRVGAVVPRAVSSRPPGAPSQVGSGDTSGPRGLAPPPGSPVLHPGRPVIKESFYREENSGLFQSRIQLL